MRLGGFLSVGQGPRKDASGDRRAIGTRELVFCPDGQVDNGLYAGGKEKRCAQAG